VAGIQFSVGGVDKFNALMLRLKDGDKQVRLAFLRAVRAAVAPLKDSVKSSALELLPKRGGLAAKIAASKYGIRTSATTVSFQTVSPFEIKTIDQGIVRHPVFGHPIKWVSEPVTPGFWSKPAEADVNDIRVAVSVAIDKVAKQIEG
jgi:hypothetical protein